jgi:hypothetical protein
MKTILVLTALLILTTTATGGAQTCPGDIDRNNMTTIDEVVAVVRAALVGCPPARGCPLRLDEPTELETCFYFGRWNPLCGGSDLEAFFTSDGEELVVSFFDPDIDFFAEVVTDGIAFLFAYELITEPPEEPQPLEGEVLLSDPPGEALTVFPYEIPFTIDDCDFERYEGRFDELVVFEPFSVSAGAAAAPSRVTARAAASRARLRALRDDPNLTRLKREAALRRSTPATGKRPGWRPRRTFKIDAKRIPGILAPPRVPG